MNRIALLRGLMMCAALGAPVSVLPAPTEAQTRTRQATAALMRADGTAVGRARFTQHGDRVEVRVEVRGLEPGWHALHVHAEGRCEGGAHFRTAGGHLSSPDDDDHPDHPDHAGDLPPLLVGRDGAATLVVSTDRFAVANLLAGDGTALMIHAQRDNFAHVPERYGLKPDRQTLDTGDGGERLACGVVRRPEPGARRIPHVER